MFCQQPFTEIEINQDGTVYTCCPPFIRYYSIGNIFRQPFDEIWNGEKIQTFRRKILNEDYSMCEEICHRRCTDETNPGFTEHVEKYPINVNISTDSTCNVRCVICRDKPYHTEYNKADIEKEINEIYLPILKDAKYLRMGVNGESLASYKETILIKRITETYPDIKLTLHTNGILGDEKKLKELNIYDKLSSLTVSVHAASRWTYNKIVKGGKWDKLMSNLALYKRMKDEHNIESLNMVCCVFKENYKEMPNFVKLAMKYDAKAVFWALRYTANTKVGDHFDEYSVTNPQNKHHKNLIKVLKNPIFDEYADNIELYPELRKLRES